MKVQLENEPKPPAPLPKRMQLTCSFVGAVNVEDYLYGFEGQTTEDLVLYAIKRAKAEYSGWGDDPVYNMVFDLDFLRAPEIKMYLDLELLP